jgi:hypothetical protein
MSEKPTTWPVRFGDRPASEDAPGPLERRGNDATEIRDLVAQRLQDDLNAALRTGIR